MCQMRQNSGSTGFSGWLPLPACGVLPAASTPCPVDGDLGASPGIRCNTFDVGGMKKAPNNGAPW